MSWAARMAICLISMESQPQNPELWNNPEKLSPMHLWYTRHNINGLRCLPVYFHLLLRALLCCMPKVLLSKILSVNSLFSYTSI